MYMYALSKFHFDEFAVQEFLVGGGGGGVPLNPPPWVKVWVKNTLGGRGLNFNMTYW